MKDLAEKVRLLNLNRDPVLLQLKYKAMGEDRYRFYKATAPFFYSELFKNRFIKKSPDVWLCGDLHFENFGSYKSDSRIAYFNINDFDECCLGPCLIDVARMTTSIYIAAANWKISAAAATSLAEKFFDNYFDVLEEGYSKTLEKETASRVVKKFLADVQSRKRKSFLKKRTKGKKRNRKIIIDNQKTFLATEAEHLAVDTAIKLIGQKKSNPEFYTVKDVAVRAAGTSSLGLKRYLVLVEGNGSPSQNYLLDLKEVKSSCLSNFIKIKQPKWNSNAERIIEIEKRIQVSPPALLHGLLINGKNFILRELQPTADKIDHLYLKGKFDNIDEVVQNMSSIYAWANLRSSGRQGSAITDDLITFAKKSRTIKKELLNFSLTFSKLNDRYFLAFSEALENGYFKS